MDQWTVTHHALGVHRRSEEEWSYEPNANDVNFAILLVKDLIQDDQYDAEPDISPSFVTWWSTLQPAALAAVKAFALPSRHKWSMAERMRFARKRHPGLWDPADFMSMCNITSIWLQRVELSECFSDGELIDYVISGITSSFGKRRTRWNRFAQSLDKPPFSEYVGFSSMFSRLLLYIDPEFHQADEIVREWVQIRLDEGVDLCHYGAIEHQGWPSTHCPDWMDPPGWMEIYVYDFSWGPVVEDWHIIVGTSIPVPLMLLHSTLGDWPPSNHVPRLICWYPSEIERHEGHWAAYADVRRSFPLSDSRNSRTTVRMMVCHIPIWTSC